MFQFHLHVHTGAATEGEASAQKIGDGTLLKLIAEYGPQLVALLLKLGLLKLPATDGAVSDKP